MPAEIVRQDDDWLQITHDFIRWLFPRVEHRRVVLGAPTLLPADISAFRAHRHTAPPGQHALSAVHRGRWRGIRRVLGRAQRWLRGIVSVGLVLQSHLSTPASAACCRRTLRLSGGVLAALPMPMLAPVSGCLWPFGG